MMPNALDRQDRKKKLLLRDSFRCWRSACEIVCALSLPNDHYPIAGINVVIFRLVLTGITL